MKKRSWVKWVAVLAFMLLFACGRTGFESDVDIDSLPDGACSTDRQCDDGVFCNGQERCVYGTCMAGERPACDDGNFCTRDSCNEFLRTCFYIPDDSVCPPGYICDPVEGCIEGCTDYETSCWDGRDNDCDGLYDCADSDCFYDPACCEEWETDCHDGRDNDCDGYTDCADWDCGWDPGCQACDDYETYCWDGVDNDCDGLYDCGDPDCYWDPACSGCDPYETYCWDYYDNDCDGYVDCADPDCYWDPSCT
jgi:hypothetical protein